MQLCQIQAHVASAADGEELESWQSSPRDALKVAIDSQAALRDQLAVAYVKCQYPPLGWGAIPNHMWKPHFWQGRSYKEVVEQDQAYCLVGEKNQVLIYPVCVCVCVC